jgi:hypothetical protein
MPASRLRLVLLAVLAVSVPAAEADDSPPAAPVEAPRHVSYDSDRGPLLLGPVAAADILAVYPDWPEELAGWQPDSVAVAELAAVTTPTDILCVMGTWCGDSQREVPRFWRLLADAGNPNLRLNMVAVGRAGDDAADRVLADLGLGGGYRAEHGIEKVPTFIFSQGGRELGRIVETPVVSLGADAAGILR